MDKADGSDPESAGERPIIGMEELVLYAIGTFVEGKDWSDKDKISESLGIDRIDLNNHLLNLREKDLIRTESRGCSCSHVPTREGWERFEVVRKAIHDTRLIPEIHGESGQLGDILPTFRDLSSVMKISSRVVLSKPLDLSSYRISMKPDSIERSTVLEFEDLDIFLNKEFEAMAAELLLAGSGPKEPISLGSTDSVRDSLAYAEALRKKSKPKDAMEIFRSVAGRCGAKSGFRVFGMVGIAKCTRALVDEDTALKMVEEFLKTAVSPMHVTLLKICKADIVSFTDSKEALDIYSKCFKSLSKKNMPVLKAAIHCNMGVAYVERDNWKQAEKSWKKGLQIAKIHNYERYEATLKLNLADAISRNGRCKKAKKLLSEAKIFFESENDLQGLSGYHYNAALVSADEGNRELSLKHFRKCLGCESVPLVYWEKRYEEMNKRFEKMGWAERFPENSQNT